MIAHAFIKIIVIYTCMLFYAQRSQRHHMYIDSVCIFELHIYAFSFVGAKILDLGSVHMKSLSREYETMVY